MINKKLFLFIIIFASILASVNGFYSQSQWVQVNNGLTHTDVRTLAVSGTNIFAGTGNGGVFRSTNNGTSWTAVNTGLTNNQVLALIVVGNDIYAGTYGGVFRSSDLGLNWQPLNNGLTSLMVLALYQSGNYIYAGTAGGGIFRLPTNGTTWSQVNNGLTTVSINAFANNSQYLFAGGTGLFRSSNNGSSWEPIGPFTSIWVHTIAVLGDDIFVGTENFGVYRSTDNGDTWSQVNNGLSNLIVQKLYVVGTGIFAGTNVGVYLSTNNGVNWSYTGLIAIAFSFATLGSDIYAGTGFTTGVYKRSISEMMSVVNVIITSDNAYVFGFGDVNGIINYYYPGVANILAAEIYSPNSGTETYTIAGSLSGKYIYIGAWSDEKTYQGTIAQFSDGNTTVLTSPTLPNPNIHWEVFATGIDLDPQSNDPEPYQPNYTPRANTNCPTLSEINNQIAIANSNAGSPTNTSVGWVSTTPINGRVGVLAFGPPNIANNFGFPPQAVSGIDQNAHWMWYNPDPTNITNPFVTADFPNYPPNLSREYLIFRVGPMDSLFTTDTCSCITPPSDMVGWWTGDGNANDISGYGNNGTLMGGANYGIGKVLQGFRIMSANDYVRVPHSPSINIMSDLSIDAWIITKDTTGTLTIVDKRAGTPFNPIGFSFYIFQGKLGFQLGDGSSTLNHEAPSPIVADGNWHHVAVTVKRKYPDGGKLYIDGNLVLTFDPTTRPGNITNTSDLWIGQRMLSTPYGFNGYIDEVELFKRALDASEIYDIWAADSCGKCKPSQPEFGQLCIYKFNDLNGDGKRNPTEGEVLLENWQFIIKDSTGNVVDSVFTTDNPDIPSCVKVPAPGTYTITEVLQPGWTPTTPNPQTVTVQPGQTINLYFGNKQGCSCIEPPSGMVGWWTMDETSGPSNDLAGFNNSGTWINQPTAVSGKVDGALSFYNDYLEVQNHLELDFGRADFSIDAWINTGNCKKQTISPIVDKFDVSSNIGYVFYLTQNPVGTIFLNLNINNVVYTSTTPIILNDPFNQWLHITVTVSRGSSTPVGYFYVNGQQVGTFTPNNGPVTNTVNLWIGNSRISQNNCIIWIDELELFNRALNASEIYDIWAADSCGKCKPSQPEFGQLCIYKFNDLNGDGKRNPTEGEVLLENWQFIIKDSTGNVVDSVFTTDNPDIPSCVKVPAPGTYTITEVLQAGWTPTTPNPQTVTVQPGQTINLYFGNKPYLKPIVVIILKIGDKNFTVNGVTKTLDSPPIIKNGRTLLPIRAVVEALGGTVDWDATEKKVTISLGSTTIELWIGKSIAKVNGVPKPIDPSNPKVVPEIINSRTMLPLRFVAESLGCDVQWDGTTQTITIKYQP